MANKPYPLSHTFLHPIAWFRQWRAAAGERRMSALTAKAADIEEGKTYNLVFLHQRGVVRARAVGQSITAVQAEVENLIRKGLRVVITPGTYFVSSGGHQNMATISERNFTLSPGSSQSLHISAVCIDANRPIPGKRDRFEGVARVPENVARFLEASRHENPMVIQAGVWTLTDSYSRYAVMNHLISRDSGGNISHPVTNAHCDRAKAILDGLGIPNRL